MNKPLEDDFSAVSDFRNTAPRLADAELLLLAVTTTQLTTAQA